MIYQFVPLLSNPAFRQLYNKTLESFPGAEIVMSASAFYITALINSYLYAQRDRIYNNRDLEKIKEEQITKMSLEFLIFELFFIKENKNYSSKCYSGFLVQFNSQMMNI